MNFKLWLESAGPLIVYHQTSVESAMSIKRSGRFSLKRATQGIVWFTNNVESLKNDTTGAGGRGAILKLSVTINNPAGWKEYENLLLVQLKSQGYDGVILPDRGSNTFDGFVFDPKKIKILGIMRPDELV